MPSISREELIQKFQTMVRERRPIIGGGAGIGLSAKCEEQGGIDLIVIYNSGRYRMAGRGSLAGSWHTVMRTKSWWTWQRRYYQWSKTHPYWLV